MTKEGVTEQISIVNHPIPKLESSETLIKGSFPRIQPNPYAEIKDLRNSSDVIIQKHFKNNSSVIPTKKKIRTSHNRDTVIS